MAKTNTAKDAAGDFHNDYNNAVREGKAILAGIDEAERGQMRLGELADQVTTKYGDRTLSKYAKDIGIKSACTLERHRSVYRAWKDIEIPAPGPESPSYAVLRALQNHKDRANLVRTNPKMTQEDARALTGSKKAKKAKDGEWLKHDKKWFKKTCTISSEAIDAAGFLVNCTPEQRQKLIDNNVVEPKLLDKWRKGGEALIKLANDLDALLKKADAKERRGAAAPAKKSKSNGAGHSNGAVAAA